MIWVVLFLSYCPVIKQCQQQTNQPDRQTNKQINQPNPPPTISILLNAIYVRKILTFTQQWPKYGVVFHSH